VAGYTAFLPSGRPYIWFAPYQVAPLTVCTKHNYLHICQRSVVLVRLELQFYEFCC
jgi:hypothetical protein